MKIRQAPMMVQISIALLAFFVQESLSFVLPQAHKVFSERGQIEQHYGQLNMAGMGMGMASKSKKKKGGKKKNGGASGPRFDVAKSMLKTEKLYDELLKEATKKSDEDHKDHGNSITSEYVIAARLNPDQNKDSIPGASSVSDWVPVAQLCVTRPLGGEGSDESAQERLRLGFAISSHCREIYYAATLGSSLFKSIPRNVIQYSAEGVDSFYKFVYEDVIEGKNSNEKNDEVMTKVESRKVLQLAEDCNDPAEFKRSYRKMSMQLHPDRFVGVERTAEEEEKSKNDFARVKIAYESLNSGIRVDNKSWYESLGGRARTDFIGSIDLVSVDNAKVDLERRSIKCAICGVNPETVMAFVGRNKVAV